jgi:hypothetical protein
MMREKKDYYDVVAYYERVWDTYGELGRQVDRKNKAFYGSYKG